MITLLSKLIHKYAQHLKEMDDIKLDHEVRLAALKAKYNEEQL